MLFFRTIHHNQTFVKLYETQALESTILSSSSITIIAFIRLHVVLEITNFLCDSVASKKFQQSSIGSVSLFLGK